MGMEDMGPRTRGGAMGGMEQERLMHEAERERLAKETEHIHAKEAEEASELGEAPATTKAPWWKFWAN